MRMRGCDIHRQPVDPEARIHLRLAKPCDEWLRHGIPVGNWESWQGVSLRSHRMAFQSRFAVPSEEQPICASLRRAEVAIECGSITEYANITSPTRDYRRGSRGKVAR